MDTHQTSNASSAEPAPLRPAVRQIRYMAQSVLLEETGTAWMTRMTIFLVALVIAGFVGWSSITNIKEVAVTHGAIVPSGSIQTVQHLEGGIVADILVKDRELVEQGQSLLRLESAQAIGELDQIRTRRMTLLLRAERLRALAEGRQPDLSFAEDSHPGLVVDQGEIHRAAIDRWASQREVLDKQISQKQKEVDAVREQQAAVQRQIRLLGEEVGMRTELMDKGYSTKVQLFAVKRQLAASESEFERLRGQEKTAREALREVISRITDLDNNVREDALNELGSVTSELAQVEEAITNAADRVRRLDVVAPVRGYVQDLKVKTLGAVIPAGGAVLDIVPLDDSLLVETRISTRDVGHVHVGLPVSVKVTTFDFARYGAVDGRLQEVSATTFLDDSTGEPFYKGLVSLTQDHVGDASYENTILPGMTVQADIITGEKTLLQYILKPIYVSLGTAFRER